MGHSIPTRWKMAEERSSEPVSAAGVHEEGAMGRGCYRRQLKRKHDLVQLSLFKSRKGEWGVQGITTLGLKGRVIRTASAPACFLCQAAGSKELEALASSPQPTARWASPTLRPTPLPHLPPPPTPLSTTGLGSHCLHMASRGQHSPTLWQETLSRLAGPTLQDGRPASPRTLHIPG